MMTADPTVKKTIILCLCILLSTGVWVSPVVSEGGQATMESFPAGGVRSGGARGGQIILSTIEDLQNMSNDPSAHYALANDINGSATVHWNHGAGFHPVGTESYPFTGSLDGRGHTIAGLYISRDSINHAGLFGVLGSGGSVSNLALTGVNITGENNVSGLVGRNLGSVTNCSVTGCVTGTGWAVGGLVGNNHRGSVTNCRASVNVTGSERVGGLVGYCYEGWIVNSHMRGTVTGMYSVGGLLGYNYFGWVMNCYATGSVTGDIWVGGLVGYNYQGSIGYCYATSRVKGRGKVGGLVGSATGGSVTACFWDRETSGTDQSSGGKTLTSDKMMSGRTFSRAGWDIGPVPHSHARNDRYIWNIVEGSTYPLLSWDPSPQTHDPRRLRIRPHWLFEAVGIVEILSFFGAGLALLYGVYGYLRSKISPEECSPPPGDTRDKGGNLQEPEPFLSLEPALQPPDDGKGFAGLSSRKMPPSHPPDEPPWE